MITLTFTIEEANAIVGMLGRQPYEQVEGLIAKIREQAIPQLPKADAEELKLGVVRQALKDVVIV